MSKSNIMKTFSFIVSAGSIALLMGSGGCTVDSTLSPEHNDLVADDDNGETILENNDQVAGDDGETPVDSIADVQNESAESDKISQRCVLVVAEDGTISAGDRRCYASEEELLIGEGPEGRNTLPRNNKTQEPSSFWWDLPVTTYYYVGDWYEHNDTSGAKVTVITSSTSCPNIQNIPTSYSGWNDRISSFRYDPTIGLYPDLGCNLVEAYEHIDYGGNRFSTQFLVNGCEPNFFFSSRANTQINVSQMGYWTSSCGQYCSQVETLNDRISSIKFKRACWQHVHKPFDRANTFSATVNYESIPFVLDRSAFIQATTARYISNDPDDFSAPCGPYGAYTAGPDGATYGDSFIRLYNTNTNQEIAANDDTSCSGTHRRESFLETTVPSGNYELRIGCFTSSSCWGKAIVKIVKQYP